MEFGNRHFFVPVLFFFLFTDCLLSSEKVLSFFLMRIFIEIHEKLPT